MWSTDDDCCTECQSQTTCDGCVGVAGCGWAYDLAQCISGASQEELCVDAMYAVLESEVSQCKPPPGPIDTDGNIVNALTQ